MKRFKSASEFYAEATTCLLAIFGTVALVWSLGSAYGSNKSDIYWRDDAVVDAKTHAESNCKNLRKRSEIECIFSILEESVGRVHEKSDLVAQERAAWGAQIAGITGAFTLFLTAVGLIYIAGTLKETRYANRRNMRELAKARIDARKAGTIAAANLKMSEATAEAAQEQVRIADNMARRQLRAYLAVEGAKIFILKPDEVVVKLVIANKGSTPARIVDLNYNLRLGPQRTIAPWEDGIPLKKRYWDGKTIGHANIESVLFW